MTPFEFRVLPWEHRGLEPAPFRELEAVVEGRLRRFAAKSHEGRVYFRLSDEDDTRVWTLLEVQSAENFEAFFRREVEANHVARFFTIERGFSTQQVGEDFQTELKARFHSSNLELLGATTFAMAVTDEGRAWAQEWCGGPWLQCPLRPRSPQSGAHKPSIWQRGWNVAGLKSALSPLAGQVAFRPFTPNLQEKEPLRFATGSRDELERLFRIACIYFAPTLVRWSQGYSFWNPTKTPSTWRCQLSLSAESAHKTASSRVYPPAFPASLLDVLVAHNLPVGGQWQAINRGWTEFDEDGEPVELSPKPSQRPARVDFTFASPGIHINVEVPREPSAHERMEAFLTLRDWLENNGHTQRARRLLQM